MFCCCKDNEKIANIRVFLPFLSVGGFKGKRGRVKTIMNMLSLTQRFDIPSFFLGCLMVCPNVTSDKRIVCEY